MDSSDQPVGVSSSEFSWHGALPPSGRRRTTGPGDPLPALGGKGRSDRRRPPRRRFAFRFEESYRLAAKPFTVDAAHAYVEVDRAGDTGEPGGTLTARFGPWSVETSLDNVEETTITGPYHVLKTIGPARLSLADRGLTFATNHDCGVCITFREPVSGIEPLGLLRHPALTVTVNDVEGLRAALSRDA